MSDQTRRRAIASRKVFSCLSCVHISGLGLGHHIPTVVANPAERLGQGWQWPPCRCKPILLAHDRAQGCQTRSLLGASGSAPEGALPKGALENWGAAGRVLKGALPVGCQRPGEHTPGAPRFARTTPGAPQGFSPSLSTALASIRTLQAWLLIFQEQTRECPTTVGRLKMFGPEGLCRWSSSAFGHDATDS